MSRVTCPFCYHRIESRRLWFVCLGQGTPGASGCKPVEDARRYAETGYHAESMPVFDGPAYPWVRVRQANCPACGGRTGQRACPCCHTPLSPAFGSTASPLIAFLGATQTGKTVYLNALALQAFTTLNQRFTAAMQLFGDDNKINIEQLRQGGLFQRTPGAVDGRVAPAVLEWRQQETGPRRLFRKYRTTYLSFLDAAGEDLSKEDKVRDQRYLAAADAIVLLLDPFMIPNARQHISLPAAAIRAHEPAHAVAQRITNTLWEALGTSPGRAIGKPVAVVFSKIDAFFRYFGPDNPLLREPYPGPYYDDIAGRQTHERVQSLLAGWDANLDLYLRLNYKRLRYFVVSSLGAEPDYEAPPDRQPMGGEGARPFRVDEPLLWIMSEFGIIPRRRSL
jgi:hypothetical protein